MCTTCGCQAKNQATDHHGHEHSHSHVHSHAPNLSESRMVRVEQDLLAKNDAIAEKTRAFLNEKNIKTLNMISSPGSGKTTLLVETLKRLDKEKCTVIEGDQQTSNDADRICATGTKAIQINTGKGCHLDAHMVSVALRQLTPQQDSILFIENVGNLICPAAFDLGEKHKIAILSVTEGEDKPLKYPDIFAKADLLLINKIDLLPYLDFSPEVCIENARRVNPDIRPITISATTGEGMQAWLDWLRSC